jgi:hypothetical protein
MEFWLIMLGLLGAVAILIALANRFDIGGWMLLAALLMGFVGFLYKFYNEFPSVPTVLILVTVSAVAGAYIHKWFGQDH